MKTANHCKQEVFIWIFDHEKTFQRDDPIWRCHLTSIGNLTVELRLSDDHLDSTLRLLLPVKQHLSIECTQAAVASTWMSPVPTHRDLHWMQIQSHVNEKYCCRLELMPSTRVGYGKLRRMCALGSCDASILAGHLNVLPGPASMYFTKNSWPSSGTLRICRNETSLFRTLTWTWQRL